LLAPTFPLCSCPQYVPAFAVSTLFFLLGRLRLTLSHAPIIAYHRHMSRRTILLFQISFGGAPHPPSHTPHSSGIKKEGSFDPPPSWG
jgi:hypothetical protein